GRGIVPFGTVESVLVVGATRDENPAVLQPGRACADPNRAERTGRLETGARVHARGIQDETRQEDRDETAETGHAGTSRGNSEFRVSPRDHRLAFPAHGKTVTFP